MGDADLLAPTSDTWARAFSLEPSTLRLRAVVARTYREYADAARAILHDAEARRCDEMSERWEPNP